MDNILNEMKARPHHAEEHFVKDGVVNDDKWLNVKKKILFILKEAHGLKDNDNDLRTIIREMGAPKWALWNRVAEIAYGILNCTDTDFPAFSEATGDEVGREVLNSIAIINIKKSKGKSSSAYDDLKYYLEKDGDLLIKQIEKSAPDIVFCGGIFGLVNQYLFKSESIDNEETFYKHDNQLVISYPHPAYQISKQMYYYGFIARYMKHLKNKK